MALSFEALCRRPSGICARSVRRCMPGLVGAVPKLATDPRPPGARGLKDRPGYLRVRVGDYRIIYTIEDDVLRVIVVRVGHRRDVYR